ncbi:MAG: aminotransferase class V-fold PLP-dependent enzyme [Anaerolineae bacterium]|nr:aminotransferase class V-fold PLP-dependent enzyme [Anaerolineae bacterium]
MAVYLDNAATSWPKPESVYRAVEDFMRNVGATPGRGGHWREEQAQRIATEARQAIAQLVNAPAPEGVIFTMNATQAINIGLKGLLRPGDHVITSSIEHNAVWRPLKALERRDVLLTAIPCAPDGTLDPEDVARAIRRETRLLVVTHASNVLGTLLPIGELGKIAHQHGIYFMVDAAQTAGAYPIDMQAMHIDLLAFAGHKGTYGPHGTGALVLRPDIHLDTIMEGGSGIHSADEAMPAELPLRLEPGSQNAAGIAGLLAGVRFVLENGVEHIRGHEMGLTRRFIERTADIPGLRILGPADLSQRVAVISLTVEGYFPDQLAAVLDKVFDVATRAGLHCAPQAHRTAGTLEDGALRFSPGYFNTEEDIDFAAQALHEAL